MKVDALQKLISTLAPDDEILLACGPGQVTDCIGLRPGRVEHSIENPRHFVLRPLEGPFSEEGAIVISKPEPEKHGD